VSAGVAASRAAVEAVWRLESARIVAGLARLVRDLGLAEDLAQDALVAALEDWPRTGVPPNPGAWLMLTARHRAIDRLRRDDRLAAKVALIGQDLLTRLDDGGAAFDEALDDGVDDDMLRLIFTACHPVLTLESQVALTLRVLGGLTTAEIARAYLVGEATIAQRVVRAKRTLAERVVGFEIPPAEEQAARLATVLRVVYLIYNEGYTATTGPEWARPELCYEALRLGRMLAEWASTEPEVHGLVALMEIQSSRLDARSGPHRQPISLLEQDRTRWDPLLIRRGFRALLRARELGSAGPYVLQAAIAASHAQARRAEDTDWAQIAALYEQLGELTPTPIVRLNHAVAVGFANGPGAGLALVDEISGLERYHPWHAVRGDLLVQLGRVEEGRSELALAAGLTENLAEQEALLRRGAAVASGVQPASQLRAVLEGDGPDQGVGVPVDQLPASGGAAEHQGDA
jgi:RNA polymerase sigma factor (sigma-70 family)